MFQQYQKTSPYPTVVVGTFTHNCSTQEQLAQELDTWLRANQGGSDINCFDYKWHCDYMLDADGVMKPHIICDEISNYRQYISIVNSGATSTSYHYENKNVVSSYIRSNKQISTSRVALNYERFLSLLDVRPVPASFEPSSMVSVTDSNIVSRTQFNTNQYCARLRELFSTFEEYAKVFILLYPTLKRGVGQEYDKSLEWTKRYGNIIYKNLNGNNIIAFPCNYWTQHINFNSDGLRAGDWYLPNSSELYKVIKEVTYGIPNIDISNCDQANKTLNKMNGTLINCNNQYILCSKKNIATPWVSSNGSYLSYGFKVYLKARKNKRRSKDAIEFEKHLEVNLSKLLKEINSRDFKPDSNYAFVVTKPKPREIFATKMKNRVIHHYLDYRLRPIYENVLSDRTFNNRKGKGLHHAIETFRKDIEEFHKLSKDVWLFHFDLKGYFPNADVEIALNQQLNIIKQYEGTDKEDLKFMMTQCLRADAMLFAN